MSQNTSSNRVAVLIASPAAPVIDDDLISRAGQALGGAAPKVLKPGVAVEFTATGDVHGMLREAIGSAPVDVAIVPTANRRKRLLIADMDSTFIEQECIDELAGAFGLSETIRPLTERAMRGEIAFEPALRERAALFRGRAAKAVTAAILRRITFTPGGRTAVASMRAAGAWTALVSGGFTDFTEPVAAHLGFDENRGNILEWEGDALAGMLREPVLGSEGKVLALDEMLSARDLNRADAIAIGDGANDIPMLKAAGLGVAFRAKPAVASVADVKIDHGDLTALLYLQGFSEDEFAPV